MTVVVVVSHDRTITGGGGHSSCPAPAPSMCFSTLYSTLLQK